MRKRVKPKRQSWKPQIQAVLKQHNVDVGWIYNDTFKSYKRIKVVPSYSRKTPPNHKQIVRDLAVEFPNAEVSTFIPREGAFKGEATYVIKVH